MQVQFRHYIHAFLYILIAVESVFHFPRTVIYARPASGVESGVLALGLLYARREGVLRWV